MSGFNSETELELESELEGLPELAQESELLFNSLAAMADRGGQSQALRRVALTAARAALRGASRPAPAIEGELEMELELVHESSATTLQELEAELEHLAHVASEAETEQEAAEQFLPLIPLVAKLALPLARRALPGIARAITRNAPRVFRQVAPSLSRGVRAISKTLYRNRTTRPLMRALPRIANTSLQSILARAANGQRITPQLVAQVLARQTSRTLGSPKRLHGCLRHSVQADRRFHHAPQASTPVRRRHRHAAYGGGSAVWSRPPAGAVRPNGAGRPRGHSHRRLVLCENCASGM